VVRPGAPERYGDRPAPPSGSISSVRIRLRNEVSVNGGFGNLPPAPSGRRNSDNVTLQALPRFPSGLIVNWPWLRSVKQFGRYTFCDEVGATLMPLPGPRRICLALFLWLLAPPFAQQDQPPISVPVEVEPGPMPNPTQGMFRVDVVVRDKSGNPVTGLKQQDFILRDNVQPGKIVSFQAFDGMTAKPDTPVEVILVIDTVNLSPESVSAAKSSVEKLLRANHGHLAQPVSVFLLSPVVLSSTLAPSMDRDTLADQVARGTNLPVVRPTVVLQPGQTYRVTGGSPAMTPEGKANRISLNALGSIVIEERRKPGRKLLFWVGPGWPVDSGRCDVSFDSVTEFSTRIREPRITIWSATAWPFGEQGFIYQDLLGPVKSAKDVKAGHLALAVLATQSSGGVLNTAGKSANKFSKRTHSIRLRSILHAPKRWMKITTLK
jgi:VWFA-related protein